MPEATVNIFEEMTSKADLYDHLNKKKQVSI